MLFHGPDNSDLLTKFQCFVNDVLLFSIPIFLINRLFININSWWLKALARYMHDHTYMLSWFCVCIHVSQNTRTSGQMRQEALKCTGIVFVFCIWFSTWILVIWNVRSYKYKKNLILYSSQLQKHSWIIQLILLYNQFLFFNTLFCPCVWSSNSGFF